MAMAQTPPSHLREISEGEQWLIDRIAEEFMNHATWPKLGAVPVATGLAGAPAATAALLVASSRGGLVARRRPDALAGFLAEREDVAAPLRARDRVPFYGDFVVEEAR